MKVILPEEGETEGEEEEEEEEGIFWSLFSRHSNEVHSSVYASAMRE